MTTAINLYMCTHTHTHTHNPKHPKLHLWLHPRCTSLYTKKGSQKKKSKFADCLRIIGQERECVVLFIGTPSLTLQIVTQMPRMGLSGSSTCWSCLSCCPGGQEETGKATRLQTQTKNADYRADTAGGAESMNLCFD